MSARPQEWSRIPISSVEDLSDAVLGAGLEVTQMSRAPVTGSLAFSTFDHGITCSSGHIGGRVALTGPLSANMVTLGVGLVMAPGTRHWLNEVTSGAVGVFLPGDEHDALYPPGSLYAVVTLPAERLEQIAAQSDLVLDTKTLGGTGIDPNKKFPAAELSRLRMQFRQIHDGYSARNPRPQVVCKQLLHAFVHKGMHASSLAHAPLSMKIWINPCRLIRSRVRLPLRTEHFTAHSMLCLMRRRTRMP